MRDEHILDMLAGGPFADLGKTELASIHAHILHCEECSRAFEVARVAGLLLKERAASTVEPPPFFQTRVMAALRERQAGNETWSFVRLWKAAGALVSSMAVAVVALAALTFLGPTTPSSMEGSQEVISAADPYLGEDMFLAQDEMSTTEISYDQALSTIYALEEDSAR